MIFLQMRLRQLSGFRALHFCNQTPDPLLIRLFSVIVFLFQRHRAVSILGEVKLHQLLFLYHDVPLSFGLSSAV